GVVTVLPVEGEHVVVLFSGQHVVEAVVNHKPFPPGQNSLRPFRQIFQRAKGRAAFGLIIRL
ncbi:MAG: hypothetical protein II953_07915, partial [Clostridia bacterium]|nr:hypothetical protein [Clostridia bacterium]